ncbi:MAG: riboflavin biosynthesis protein RibF [Clostridia bacterium]|nr:riboflavin biosynthesis protein RibF [Clostridia bacterium]
METVRVRGTAVPHSAEKTVLALGFFDGVHAGHSALLARVREEAARLGAIPAVCSFSQGSGIKEDAPRLTSESDRLAALSEASMARVYLLDFAAVRDMSCEDFCTDILVRSMNAAAVVCGFNFRFGRGGTGDTETLTRLLAPHGVTAVILPPVTHGEGAISSSVIRVAVEAGDMERARELLGRPFTLTGEVMHGKSLGHRIGFPTANLAVAADSLLPARGVYAVRAEAGGKEYNGVANVGVRPTVEQNAPVNCEVHLFGGEVGDLYGKPISVRFYKHLRGEMKFESIDALCAQIARDEAQAKEYFHG